MTDILYRAPMTTKAAFTLIALLCEENGFWPDVQENPYSDTDFILDHRFVCEHKLEYVREVTSLEARLFEMFYESKTPEDWAQLNDKTKEDYSTCHLEVTVQYAANYTCLRWFYSNDDDYEDRVQYYYTCDAEKIIDILKSFNLK